MADTPVKAKRARKTKPVAEKPYKSTKAEVDQRVTEITSLLLDGYTRSYILKYGQKWKVSDNMIDQYTMRAWEQIKEINLRTAQENLSMVTTQLLNLLREARRQGNISEQRQIIMSIAKLRGLEQININHVIEDKREFEDMSEEALLKALDEASHASH